MSIIFPVGVLYYLAVGARRQKRQLRTQQTEVELLQFQAYLAHQAMKFAAMPEVVKETLWDRQSALKEIAEARKHWWRVFLAKSAVVLGVSVCVAVLIRGFTS